MPFCFHKCHYCDFYSIVDRRDRQAAFTDRLLAELELYKGLGGDPVETVFVGGGTPTLLAPEHWRRLLAGLAEVGAARPEAEFTVEANPETVTPELAAVLAGGGVNRISVGAQTFDVRHLKTLERWHDPESVGRSVGFLRDAGIGRINLDLIFAVPGQTLAAWRDDLDRALDLDPEHVSTYGLTYEPGTAMTARLGAGAFEPADDALEAAMYRHAETRLADAGFEHYEISAWARPGERCRHNLVYWSNGDWWPIGPAAAGHVQGLRWRNVPHLGDWLAHGPWPPIVDVERPDARRASAEGFMLGLRLIDGLARERVDALLALAPEDAPRRERAIARHVDDGSLQWENGRLRFTPEGRLVADDVLSDLI